MASPGRAIGASGRVRSHRHRRHLLDSPRQPDVAPIGTSACTLHDSRTDQSLRILTYMTGATISVMTIPIATRLARGVSLPGPKSRSSQRAAIASPTMTSAGRRVEDIARSWRSRSARRGGATRRRKRRRCRNGASGGGSMRTRPLVGARPWFGPRRTGWGWTPTSWQGWLVTIVGLGIIALAQATGGTTDGLIALAVVVAVLVVLALLFGASPGGPSDADAYRAEHRTLRSELPPDEPGLSAITDRLEHREH